MIRKENCDPLMLWTKMEILWHVSMCQNGCHMTTWIGNLIKVACTRDVKTPGAFVWTELS